MCIPLIKDRYSLIDLTRYGTKARKHVHSDVLIGSHPPYPLFKEGDVLDANATYNLILMAYDHDKVYKILSERIDGIEESVNDNFYEIGEDIRNINNSVSDIKNKQDAVDASLRLVTSDVQQCQSDIQNVIEKHNTDIQDVKDYVDDKIYKLDIRAVYDAPEENLFMILDKG